MIAILISTYNSEKYLRAQLDSLLQQTCRDTRFFIRDDQSHDSTPAILREYADRCPGRFCIVQDGENVGPKSSFFRLIQAADADYYMFCDHDDVWLPDKAALSLKAIQEMERSSGTDTPLMVHTDLKIVDENLQPLADSFYQSPLPPATLAGILTANICPGCTEMFNQALKRKLKLDEDPRIIMHDYWIALTAAAFGRIGYVDQGLILYRQHHDNYYGYVSRFSVLKQIAHVTDLKPIQEIYRKNRENARAFQEHYQGDLSEESSEIVHAYCSLHSASLVRRAELIRKYHFDFYYRSALAVIGQLLFS